MIPVLFLGFANDTHHPLATLNKESEKIYHYLMPYANEQRIQIHREPQASIANISDYLIQFNNRVTLFHYGGHADSQSLFLSGKSARAAGIAYQLAQQKSLKLVFLNGCSTRQQVELLLELGIPVVIATSVPVNDASATAFAIDFYKGIAAHQSIEVAFEKAAATVMTKTAHHPRIYRGLGRVKKNHLPWGLYTLDEDNLEAQLIPPLSSIDSGRNIVDNVKVKLKKGNVTIGNTYKGKQERSIHKIENKVNKSNFNIEEGDFRVGDDHSN